MFDEIVGSILKSCENMVFGALKNKLILVILI